MNEKQRVWLQNVDKKIKTLIQHIVAGNHKAGYIIGTRTINGQQVRLWVTAEVIDDDENDTDTDTDQQKTHTDL